VSGWLIGSRVEIEWNHQASLIVRSGDVRTTISVSHILVVELSGEVVVEIDTMSLHSQGIDRLVGDVRSRRCTHIGRSDCDRHRTRSRSGTSGRPCSNKGGCDGCDGRKRETSGSNRGELMPVGKIGLLTLGTKTNEEALNGPFQVLEENLLSGERSGNVLLTMHTDECKANSFYKDLMDLRVHENIVNIK